MSRPVSSARLLRLLLVLGLILPVLAPLTQAQTRSNSDTLSAVTRGSLRSILAPLHDIKLSSRAAGVVEKLHLPEGSRVSAGDALLSLDSQQETAEVAQADATLRGIEVEYERAASEFARAEALFKDQILAEKQYLEYRSNHLVLKTKRDQAKAGLDLAQARLDNRTVRSPIAGIFLKTSKSVGEAVERFETIAQVVDASTLRLVIYCDPSILGRFQIGQTVPVQVQPTPERSATVNGTIHHIDPIIDASSGTFRIVVEIIPSDDAIAGLPAMLLPPAKLLIGSNKP